MKIIAHRGNLNGSDVENENKPETILRAISLGFDVEIDIRVIDGEIYLGHDSPQYKIDVRFLKDDRLWIHCKNKEALELMLGLSEVHYFWHQTDTYTLTSKGFVWGYVGADIINNSICVMPETEQDLQKCYGICTDYPIYFCLKESE